ncbi:histidinol-phosphate transaminase [Gammaproteobacteria bacterium 42_54_T18]|nr:histidinol-phosphate transaminase [Gammaproteobacteria bacterium 42_54_T18]
MGCDFIALATPGVKGLTPYQPGKPVEELERELGINNIIKLASNENPLGPSALALKAIEKAVPDLARYPDGGGFNLKQALSSMLGVNIGQITLGNGSNDVLDLIARAYLSAGDEAIFSQYAFAVYPVSTQAVGATAVITPAKDYGHDLDAMVEAITDKTRVIFIANPNNPTGNWLTGAELEHFLSRVPESVVVVLDEAYFEYAFDSASPDGESYPDGLVYLSQYPNVIVTRTFSKAYGLASLRVGYGISNLEVADILNRVRQPFNVNSLALVAAEAALADKAYLQQGRELNKSGVAQLQAGFDALGLSYVPSAGNFVLVHFEVDAQPIFDALLKRGVIVRPVGNYGMPNALRVSVGTEQENKRFLDSLAEIL